MLFTSSGDAKSKEEGDSLAEDLEKLKVEGSKEKAQDKSQTEEKLSENSTETSLKSTQPESDKTPPGEATELKSDDTAVTATS